jgi:tRNA uridine 5-carboxymethylaminomethyl modification enzyme
MIAEKERLHETRIKEQDAIGLVIAADTEQKIKGSINLADLLRRPGFHYSNLEHYQLGNPDLDEVVKEGVEIEIKYSGYIKRQQQQIEQVSRHSHRRLPQNMNYMAIATLSMEAREKLTKVQPLTVGQATRIGGVNPADINALLVYLETQFRASFS